MITLEELRWKIRQIFKKEKLLKINCSSFINNTKVKFRLRKLTIEIGTPCNLSCEMCFLSGFRRKNNQEAKKPGAFLSLELFKKIIDEIVNDFLSVDTRKPHSINLTGGESFLHPEIFNMLSYAQKWNVGLTIFTNGTLIDRQMAKKIVESETEALVFSLDGPEKIHDRIRGTGNFGKTYVAIKLIQEEKIKLNSAKPAICINSIFNNLNIDYLEEFILICEELKIDELIFSHIVWSNLEITEKILGELNSRLNCKEPLSKIVEAMEHNLYVKREQLEILLEKIKRIKNTPQTACSFRIIFFPDLLSEEIRRWYSSDIYKIDFCYYVSGWIRIGVNGDVYPTCLLMPYLWGNLKKKSLREILKSAEIKKFFTAIEADGLFYACQRCCRRPAKSQCLLDQSHLRK